jgi:formylglycine-generating enzyme required for sulfatase activity
MTPTNADLRQFINQRFSDEELETLCFDYFPEVAADFGGGMSKNRKAIRLIGYCENRSLLPNLYAALEKERPSAWREAFATTNVETGRRPVSTAANTRDPRQVFLSHATADAGFAQRLKDDLLAEGWRVWIAPASIHPGEKWVEAIDRGLETSGVFVVALTPAAVASRWVNTETDAAVEMEHEGVITFIPLEVAPCQPKRLWRQYQYVSFRGSYEAGLDALLRRLDGEPVETNHQPVETGRRPVSTPPPDRRVHAKTGIELIRIPAGPFLYGSADSDKMAQDDEKPQRTIDLPEYWIGCYPVTNAQFARFVQATGYKTTAESQGYGWGWTGSNWDQIKGADWRHPRGPKSSIDSKNDHPVVQVSWDDAQAFCDWAGLILPSEQQWEKAARGTDGRIYPWGNEWVDGACNTSEAGVGGTTPVGRYSPLGDSPYGCADMAGNVWEWTRSWYDASQNYRVLRGGSWFNSQRLARVARRSLNSPDLAHDNSGFRVAAPVVSES